MLMCCVYAFLLHRESPDMILGDERLISEVVLSQFNSNWFICVGFTNPSLFWSLLMCNKLHMKTESLDF
jgi:hypothetical protein